MTKRKPVKTLFTANTSDPMKDVEWSKRDASIVGADGKAVFHQKDVEAPKDWSQSAVNIVASKYFNGKQGTPQRETSVAQLINRVADTIHQWGLKDQYFDEAHGEVFAKELKFLLVNQYAAFNSPVWFNVGTTEKPQCSACFINGVDDSMESILDLMKTEGMLFKGGSGAGSNLSRLRASMESLSSGGIASGPLSFMRGLDASAGAVKSGGKTRRAAKMVMLDVDHPDIEKFIDCKMQEEKKAWALIDAGYDGGFNVEGGAYDSVSYQNANHSVRVNKEFMNALSSDGLFSCVGRVDKNVSTKRSARGVLRKMAEAAWVCGDPGIQYDDTINAWHTCPNTDKIRGSNPCSEYMFLDDSACNLASLNLMKFLDENMLFDESEFLHAVDIMILAQEIIVGNSSYPTKKIEENSHKFRPLGLGYANLGALLMVNGLAYDSVEGRSMAARITSMMCAQAYIASAYIAADKGPFEGFAENRDPMLNVIRKHADASRTVTGAEGTGPLWQEAIDLGEKYGFRNSQVTVLAPTGTIGFMMDCDTTGIEPEIALVKYKTLVGGGSMKIVNQSVRKALEMLYYDDYDINKIIDHISETGTIEGAETVGEDDLPVFDCAFKAQNGTRSIEPMGHLRMMAAVQPFLSGAISKTVNMPTSCTVEDIEEVYKFGHAAGLKAIAVYRDGCKRSQPLNTSEKVEEVTQEVRLESRKKLPTTRTSITHKFSIGGHEGYFIVGLYEDGRPGELFCKMSKEGSTISGFMDSFATAISMTLQYGVPLEVLVDKFSHTRFEPSGFTGNKVVPIATSIVDYIFRWLKNEFIDGEPVMVNKTEKKMEAPSQSIAKQSDAPPCATCGSIMVRNGSCYKCLNCGSTSGCS